MIKIKLDFIKYIRYNVAAVGNQFPSAHVIPGNGFLLIPVYIRCKAALNCVRANGNRHIWPSALFNWNRCQS